MYGPKKERGSSYFPSIIVYGVDSVVQQDAATEMDDHYEGPWPNFEKFEMKLQQTTESCEVCIIFRKKRTKNL